MQWNNSQALLYVLQSLVEWRLQLLAAEDEEGGDVDDDAAHRQRDDERTEQALRHPPVRRLSLVVVYGYIGPIFLHSASLIHCYVGSGSDVV